MKDGTQPVGPRLVLSGSVQVPDGSLERTGSESLHVEVAGAERRAGGEHDHQSREKKHGQSPDLSHVEPPQFF